MELDKAILKSITEVIKKPYELGEIPLHEPFFESTNALKYVSECINSGFVSSIGKWGSLFEDKICDFTGAKNAILVTNGTVGLRLGLHLAGVKIDNEVLIPPISFVASANAVSHLGACPHFIDINEENLGMCPIALEKRLNEIAEIKNGVVINKITKKVIKAIMPVHIFGNPAEIIEIKKVSKKWNLPIVEDAAEALGSWKKDGDSFVHCGLFGEIGLISFNGNKIITCGGGGVLITNNQKLANEARHLSTTAKKKHKYMFDHDQIGWNDRMPSLNAALGLSQIEELENRISLKKKLYKKYQDAFSGIENVRLITSKKDSISNNWLISLEIIADDYEAEETSRKLLNKANDLGIHLRPLWKPLNKLSMYKNCQKGNLKKAEVVSKRIISLPSSPQLML